jgi:transposase InsO family protein
MYMAYTTNPNLPRVRMQAVELVRSGWSIRAVARHLGYSHNAILKWLERKPEYGEYGRLVIPNRSSRPDHHPRELSQEIIHKILDIRAERDQCAEIIHWRLAQEGIFISISSVKRTLKRLGISKYSKWKKWHQYPPRPLPERPGLLVEVDAVHEGPPDNRVSAYALIDVNSRWAYAEPSLRINTWSTIKFVEQAKIVAPFAFQTIQTDHGSEFSKQLTKVIEHAGISHRHSRVRTPTDNGHVERFIRTLQDECLHKIPRDFRVWQKEIPEFIRYYNTERPHMGLEMKTPMQVVTSY